MIHADEKYEKRKKTRILANILAFETCDLWVDFVILLEAHYSSYNCSSNLKITEKGLLDPVEVPQTFSKRLINSETDFNETEILNNFTYTNP